MGGGVAKNQDFEGILTKKTPADKKMHKTRAGVCMQDVFFPKLQPWMFDGQDHFFMLFMALVPFALFMALMLFMCFMVLAAFMFLMTLELQACFLEPFLNDA